MLSWAKVIFFDTYFNLIVLLSYKLSCSVQSESLNTKMWPCGHRSKVKHWLWCVATWRRISAKNSRREGTFLDHPTCTRFKPSKSVWYFLRFSRYMWGLLRDGMAWYISYNCARAFSPENWKEKIQRPQLTFEKFLASNLRLARRLSGLPNCNETLPEYLSYFESLVTKRHGYDSIAVLSSITISETMFATRNAH